MPEAMNTVKKGGKVSAEKREEAAHKPAVHKSLRDILEAANSASRGLSGESTTDRSRTKGEVTSKASNPRLPRVSKKPGVKKTW